MFRRSRFSIRPNVGTAGRTTATPQEAPSVNQEAGETPKDVSESSAGTAVTDNKSVVTPSEKPTAPGDDQNGEGSSSSAAVQRRKRFSIKPKVAPGRPSTLARTAKAPVKAVSATPVEVSGSDLDKPTTTSATTAAPQGLQSPRRRRLSEESKQLKVQPKPTLIPSDSSGPSAVPLAEDSGEQTHLPSESSKQLESTSGGQVKEVPSRLTDKVPPSLPDRESIEISEEAKTLVSSKSGLSLSPPAYTLSRLLNDPSDLQRLAKARKLRELLRQEMHKEKKIKKAKARPKEYSLDPAKMTMRDLIRYLPMSNPMSSSLEAPENETVVPPSPEREELPEKAQEPEVPPKIASPREEEEEEEAEAAAEEAAAEEEQDDALMVPQVKVAEDGSLIIDEESLTVEVQRAKGPNTIQDRDPIFERGSTTTYSSFRKGTYSKPWSNEETDMFFLAISMVGTDFSMICQLFPHRARSEIKNKFKKEERENAWRIDKAFRERRKLDIEYFSKLLEKILEVQKNRKKLKSLAEKNAPKKNKKKAKGTKAARKLSDVEEEDEEEENEMPDLEGEGEKENEGGTPVSKPKRKRKRKTKEEGSTEEPDDKKNKKGEKSSDQDEAYIPEETEAALPEDRKISDMSEKTENEAKDTAIKPAKLSRGRAPKPLLPLGRKWGKKSPAPSTKAKDASDKGDESASDKEQVNKDASPIRQANKRKSADDDISSEEEDASVQPPRPTRYGRVPKPTKPLTYPAKDEPHSSTSETTPAFPAGSTASAAKPKLKCTAKRGRSSKPQLTQESKKPKLVTLRASQSESSDEENEQQWEEKEEEEQHPSCSKDSTAVAFVPASLRSPQPVIAEVEETMEEDVIDFLSSEHTEVSEDESYNEAAQTLLTIGNMAHLSQSAQNLTAIQDHTTETSVSVDDTIQNLEEEIASQPAAQEENSATSFMAATSGQEVTETSETVALEELQNSTTDSGDMPISESSDQRTGSDLDPTPQIEPSPEKSKKNSPQTRIGRLSKVKPKPNLGQASRTAKSKSQPETNTGRIDEESHIVAPSVSQATETLSAAEEIPKIADSGQKLDEISCIEVKLTEEPSGSQEKSAGQEKSGAAKNSISNLVTSDTAVPESKGINIDSAPVQQRSAHPAPCVTPVEDSPVSQKEESEDASACQTKKSRFQRVKPKPNLAKTSRTVQSKPQTTKDTVKKDSSPTSNHEFHEKTIEVEAEPTCTTSPEKPSKSTAPASESGDHPAPCVTPVKDLPDSQKEGNEDASTYQARKSRFQRFKPKPNLAQTSTTLHSKPQTTKDTVEKGSNPTPSPKFHEKTVANVEADPTSLTPTEALSAIDEKKTDVAQVESVSATTDQRASENHDSEAQLEPSRARDTRHTKPTSEPTEEKLMSQVGKSETSCSNLLTLNSAILESQVRHEPNIEAAPVQESSDHPDLCVTPVKELPSSEKEKSEDTSTDQARKSRFQRVKPKPNLPQTSRAERSKPQTTKDPVVHMQPVEKPSGPTSTSESSDNTIVETGAQPTCSTTPPERPSQIKRTTTTQAKDSKPSEPHHMKISVVTSEQQPLVINKLTEKDSKHLTSAHCSLELLSSTKSGPAESEKSVHGTNFKGTSSDGIMMAASSCAVLTDSALGNKSSEKSTIEKESPPDKVVSGPACQLDSKQDITLRATETDTQPTDDPTAISDVQSSENRSTEAEIKPANTQSIPDPEESTRQPHSEKESEAQSQHAVHQYPEMTENKKDAQSTDDNESKPVSSSKSSRKDPQTRRGRLVKPKPNLGSKSQPPRPQQVRNAKQLEADSGTCSEAVDASLSHKPVSELQPHSQEPVEGAIEQDSHQNFPPNDAGSSPGCLTQVPDNYNQDASTSATGGTQRQPSLTIFPDMLSQQLPSDPEEPFFILSLTEIPVCSSGDVLDPYLPVTDTSVQQQSVPGESLAVAGNRPLSDVAVTVSTEESGETGLNVKDDAAHTKSSSLEKPVDPNESTARVQPSKLPDTEENNDETEPPPTKQRLKGTGRTAKVQVKPKTPRQKQASKTLPAKEEESTQDSELPGPSVQPKILDGDDHLDIEKNTLACGKDLEDSRTGAETTQTRSIRSQNRKPQDNTAPSSEPPSGKAASKRPQVKTPRTAGKRSKLAPVASTPHDVAPTTSQTQLPENTNSALLTQAVVDVRQTSEHSRLHSDQTPSTSPGAAEVSASQQSDNVESSLMEDEPTSVSQYFLCDIFTDVEEG
ncbi:uncharacterized protein [Pagrus major]|uniref:uncharacterized protein isoform X2 n=1 Tax=Pagrus major TaxID=143350 RepID=UPI003CC8BA41